MIYKGHKIEEKVYKTVEEEDNPIREYGTNFVEFGLEDLEELAAEYKKKEEELINADIDFKCLKMVFWAQDYDYNPNGHDTDEEAKIYFSYNRMETDEESDERMLREMSRIDREIKDEERQRNAKKLAEKVEVERAMKVLEKNGYKVSK